jgi:hypothetical protein
MPFSPQPAWAELPAKVAAKEAKAIAVAILEIVVVVVMVHLFCLVREVFSSGRVLWA